MENNIRDAESAVKHREQAIRSREEALVQREEAIRRREDVVEQREEASIYRELEAERLRSDLDTELQVIKEKSKALSNQAEDQAARYRAVKECVQEADRIKVLMAEHSRKLTGAAAAAGPSGLPSAATEQTEATLRFTLKRGFEEILSPSHEETPRRCPQSPKRTKTKSSTPPRSGRQTSATTGLQSPPEPSSPEPSSPKHSSPEHSLPEPSSPKQSCEEQPNGKAMPKTLDLAKTLIARMQLPKDWTNDDMTMMEARILAEQHTTDKTRNPLLALDWCANHQGNTCWYQRILRRKYIIENDTGKLCFNCRKTQRSLCINVSFMDGQQKKSFDPSDSSKRWAIHKRQS